MVSSQSQAPSSNTTSTVTTNNCSQGEAASTSPTTTTLLSSSSENGEITEKQKKKKNKNCSQYGTLQEMATDINDGVPSKTIEKIIFKNMMKIMLEKFNEQKKN